MHAMFFSVGFAWLKLRRIGVCWKTMKPLMSICFLDEIDDGNLDFTIIYWYLSSLF